MAKAGYWAICEAIRPKGDISAQPSAYFVHVPGFFNADVLAETQFEAMHLARRKLKDNIDFLQRCFCDVPDPQSAAHAPDQKYPDGAILFFIALEELRVEVFKEGLAA